MRKQHISGPVGSRFGEGFKVGTGKVRIARDSKLRTRKLCWCGGKIEREGGSGERGRQKVR